MQSCDVGSLPFVGDFKKFEEATRIDPLLYALQGVKYSDLMKYFEDKVVQSFIDKAKAGIDVPAYPQFRDMNLMFLNMIDGIIKTKEGYMISGKMSIKHEKLKIHEVSALRKNISKISEKLGKPVKIKVCITGVYTLSHLFAQRRSELFFELGRIMSQIVEGNIFNKKAGRVEIISLDEPTLGVVDDPLIDYGSDGRELLLKAWEDIFTKAKAKGAQTCLHLHDTTDEIFWQVKSLDIVESHVHDKLYSSKETKSLLERTDKFLKASICVTNFNTLIEQSISGESESAKAEKLGEIWKDIINGKVDPNRFLEDEAIMHKRLKKIVERFGEEHVKYAGPECGLKSLPTYQSAIECLRKLSNVVKGV